MMSKPEIQILLCGVGGQGINGTTRRLHEHCLSQGWHCLSAVYKGGAQRLGSVKAEIRLFPLETSEVEHKSSQIMPGTLDVLLVLEQWEGLRNIPMCNKNTLLVIDDYVEFPPGNRNSLQIQKDPKSLWELYSNPIIQADFKQQSVQQYGNSKYTATCMLNAIFARLELPIKPIEK